MRTATFRELIGGGPATVAKLHGGGVFTWAVFASVLRALVQVLGIIADELTALSGRATHLASDRAPQRRPV